MKEMMTKICLYTTNIEIVNHDAKIENLVVFFFVRSLIIGT